MREQNEMKQSVLGQHVNLIHALDWFPIFLRALLLQPQRTAADLAQIVVVENIAQQTVVGP